MQYVSNYLAERFTRLIPGLDEVAVRQLAITILPVSFSILAGCAWALIFFLTGFSPIALAYLVFALLYLCLFAIALLWPRWVSPMVVGTGLVAIVTNLYIHAQAGGFTADLWALAWVPLMPLSTYFTSGRRSGALTLAFSIVALVIAVLFDRRFAVSPLAFPYPLLLAFNLITLVSITFMGFLWAEHLISQLTVARRQADTLLLNILPQPIASRLKKGQKTIADSYNEVTVLFADIVDFTTMSAAAESPVAVVDKLNEVFSEFDTLVAKYGLEKIKTIGDAYMVASGLPMPRPDHVEAVVAFAVEMLEAVGRHRSWTGDPIRLRVGINTGPVVAGVIGHQKFIYDLWGDAVNVASRMESNGIASQIQVTAAVRERLGDRYQVEERPPIYVKGKGEMVTYLLKTPLELHRDGVRDAA
jgi:class 3 adenylate cyclase